jgi:hypothetical protein
MTKRAGSSRKKRKMTTADRMAVPFGRVVVTRRTYGFRSTRPTDPGLPAS